MLTAPSRYFDFLAGAFFAGGFASADTHSDPMRAAFSAETETTAPLAV